MEERCSGVGNPNFDTPQGLGISLNPNPNTPQGLGINRGFLHALDCADLACGFAALVGRREAALGAAVGAGAAAAAEHAQREGAQLVRRPNPYPYPYSLPTTPTPYSYPLPRVGTRLPSRAARALLPGRRPAVYPPLPQRLGGETAEQRQSTRDALTSAVYPPVLLAPSRRGRGGW